MSPGFAKASAAVRDHAARFFGVRPDAVSVLPFDEVVADSDRIGKLWGFDAQVGADTISVFAAPDGTVVSHQQNLGLLFEEAGVWTASPKLTADDLAAHIAGSMGMGYRVVVNEYAAPPELMLDASGAGALVFHVSHRQPGPFGAGGPIYRAEARVVLTPDHQATLELGAWQSP